ncbi:MAG TPA: hypothetical protein VLJ80_13120 [Solirubrobacteraceae bacterium]|nr:hypothetical protein [Solirubrobacteraceae bacterium]
MIGCARRVADHSDGEFWLEIGRRTAAAYASHEEWLFRRVETIELIDVSLVKRSISVDFEMPRGLPKLRGRAAPETKLVPISVYYKWPPLMDFSFVGPEGHPTSLYKRATNKKLDFGLLLGMAEKALSGRADDERLAPQLIRELEEVVEQRRPSKDLVANATNQLRAELKSKLADALRRERLEGHDALITQIAATVDLAGRLSDSSILWVAATGRRGTDRIVKFSYSDLHRAPSDLPHGAVRDDATPEGSKLKHWRRQLEIACSWRARILHVPLPHAGRYVRFHVDVRTQGGVELAGVEVKALSPAAPTITDPTAAEQMTVVSVQDLARKYPEELDVPDEWIGPESSRYYLAYDKQTTLTLTSSSPPKETDVRRKAGYDENASTRLVKDRAHVYLGAESTPSHRVWLQLKLAVPRSGFIKGCMLTAFVVALLMTAAYVRLSSAAEHLDATVVLLSIVPVVLGYVLVRPGEQALERDHITGVRTIAMLAGAMPIVGALALVLTHVHRKGMPTPPPDLSLVKPIWLGLTIAAWLAALALTCSWRKAPASRMPRQRRDALPIFRRRRARKGRLRRGVA